MFPLDTAINNWLNFFNENKTHLHYHAIIDGDGVNQLSTLITRQREAVYVNNYSTPAIPNPSEPTKILKHNIPFSS